VRSATGPRVNDGTVAVEARQRPGWIRKHVFFLVALDATAAVAATAIARYVRFGAEPAELLVRTWSVPYSLLGVILVPTWLVVLALGRCYDVGPFGTGVRLRRVIRAGANFMALVAVTYFVLQVENLRRGFLAVAVTLAVVFTLAFRALARRYLRAARREGRAVRRALVVGTRPTVAAVIRRLGRRRGIELRPVGACVPDPDRPLLVNERDVTLHGGLDDVLPAINASGADAVVLTGSVAQGRVQRLAWALEGTGIDVFVVPALAQQPVDLDVRPVAGLPLVYVNQGHSSAPRSQPVPAGAASTADGVATNGATVSGNGNATEATVSGNGNATEATVSGNGNATEATVSGNGNGAATGGTRAYDAADGAVADGTTASGAATNGATANGTTANGTSPNGTAAAGTAAAGTVANGTTANGRGDTNGRRASEPYAEPAGGNGHGPVPSPHVPRRPPAKAPARR
jgi:CoA-binding domain